MLTGRNANKDEPQSPHLLSGDLVPDAALVTSGDDRFDHEAIVATVADLAVNATTPVNIALFGPWGSGKSSFFGLLSERLQDEHKKTVKVARYDAWKYGGRALKKHFVSSVVRQVSGDEKDIDRELAHGSEVTRLEIWSWFKTNWASLLIGLGFAVAIAVVWFLLVFIASWAAYHHGFHKAAFSGAANRTVAGIGTVLGIAFAALLVGPKVLESAVVKVTTPAPETDDEFAKSFQQRVAKMIDASKGERLVIFIDELDRCSPEDVVATLIDLKTFLDVPGCVFVVAADREVLERALHEVPQANPVRGEDPYYSTPGAFLDKIFQHQIPLPPLRPQALSKFARELVQNRAGVWAELRDAQPEERLFLRVIYVLIPAHVRSPRRAKVLLNNFATTARIAQARGIDWTGRAEELAFLTVLQTEFPAVAADLIRIPRLLGYLRGDDPLAASYDVEQIVAGYTATDMANSTEGAGAPAGDLLGDTADAPAQVHANKIINAQLRSYLRKVAGAGTPDPRPDLFYLESAGSDEGLDPDLGSTIDFAADLSSEEVVEAFSSQPSKTIATGMRLLIQQAEAERGPGRTNIIEAICRLAERLDGADVQAVAPVVAGTVLAEASGPEWPVEATPGALILGVIGASKPLVDALLSRQAAEDLAEAGVLGRIAAVLNFATTDQAALVEQLLGSAYHRHPEPLHDALHTTNPEIALNLWAGVEAAVRAAILLLASPVTPAVTAASVAARVTGAAAVPSATDEQPEDTAADRYEALLQSVEARTDDDSEALISAVLGFGQSLRNVDVQEAANARAEDAMERIGDPGRRSDHAMLGLQYAPLIEAKWWSNILSEPAVEHLEGYNVFERLTQGLATSNGEETKSVLAAAPAVVERIPVEQLGDTGPWLSTTLGTVAWSTPSAVTHENREALHKVAATVRPRLADDDAAALDSVLATDIVSGLGTNVADESRINEVLGLARATGSSTAAAIEGIAKDHVVTPADAVPTLRLRIAAASRGSDAVISGVAVLTVKGMEGEKLVLREWLAMAPPLGEALQVLGQIPVTGTALGTYAAQLTTEERTDLWVHMAGSGKWTQVAFDAVGAQGINSAAIEITLNEMKAATQQAQRTALVDRLVGSTLREQPMHKVATDLVLYLLNTGTAGDLPQAARVAICSGGAAYGKVVEVRNAFDAAAAQRSTALSKTQRERLQEISLLTRPPKRKGLLSTLLGA